MNKTKEYINEVLAEAKHITWPSRKQTINFTIAVLIVSVVTAYYLGLLDFSFSKGLEFLLNR